MSKPRHHRATPIVLIVVGVFAILACLMTTLAACISTISATQGPDAAETPAVIATVATNEPITPTSQPAARQTSVKAQTIRGDGVFLVGDDVKPGRYTTRVPDDSFNCYWARLTGTSGQFSDIIANNNVNPGGQAVVTIGRNDVAFETNGCGTWTRR
jgi:hypothetical protein